MLRRTKGAQMLYSLYEITHWSVGPMRLAAQLQAMALRSPLNPIKESEISRTVAAASDLFEAVTRRYAKPDWKLPETNIQGVSVPVRPERVWSSQWCNLVHF